MHDGPLAKLFLEIAKDGEPRTAVQVAVIINKKLPSMATKFLRRLMSDLTLARSEYQIKPHPPARGSKALLWRVESRDPDFVLIDGNFLPRLEPVEGQRGERNRLTASRRPGWRLPVNAETSFPKKESLDDEGREASSEYSKSRGMSANKPQPKGKPNMSEGKKRGRPRKEEMEIENQTTQPGDWEIIPGITDEHIKQIEKAVYVQSGHWGVVDPKRLVQAVLQVMGGAA